MRFWGLVLLPDQFTTNVTRRMLRTCSASLSRETAGGWKDSFLFIHLFPVAFCQGRCTFIYAGCKIEAGALFYLFYLPDVASQDLALQVWLIVASFRSSTSVVDNGYN